MPSASIADSSFLSWVKTALLKEQTANYNARTVAASRGASAKSERIDVERPSHSPFGKSLEGFAPLRQERLQRAAIAALHQDLRALQSRPARQRRRNRGIDFTSACRRGGKLPPLLRRGGEKRLQRSGPSRRGRDASARTAADISRRRVGA